MPSEAPQQHHARCYCGATTLSIKAAAITVAYCHCDDCKRWTGAPLPAFAAFPEAAVTAAPELASPLSIVPGVDRWSCGTCHSPVAARFDYLPGQIYIPLGTLDTAERLPPAIHCHDHARYDWLHIQDDLPRSGGSGRDSLNKATPT